MGQQPEAAVTGPIYMASVAVTADLGTGPDTAWLQHSDIDIAMDGGVTIGEVLDYAVDHFQRQLAEDHPAARVFAWLNRITPKGKT